jgi:hypothetical protein
VSGSPLDEFATIEVNDGDAFRVYAYARISAGAFSSAYIIPQEGRYTIRAQINDIYSEAFDIVAGRDLVDIALYADKDEYTVGEAGLFTAFLSDADATGSVVFRIDGADIGRVAVVSGEAELSHSFAVEGQPVLTAFYEGDENYAPSISTGISLDVVRSSMTLAVSANATQYRPGDIAELSATIAGGSADIEVIFSIDGQDIGTVQSSGGMATITHEWMTEGAFEVQARFVGDDTNQQALSNVVSLQVAKGTVFLSLERRSATITPGQDVSIALILTEAMPGEQIDVLSDQGFASSITLGSGTEYIFTVPAPMSGEIALWATFSGNRAVNAARSNDLALAAQSSAASVSLAVSPTAPKDGEAVNLTASVSPSNATGTVVFLVNDQEIATATLIGGVTTADWVATAGTHVLSARYQGDGRYDAAASQEITIIVTEAVVDRFEGHKDAVKTLMQAEAQRAATARARQTDRILERTRDKLRDRMKPKGPATPGWVDGEWEPFRWQGDFSTLDGASNGRASFMAGGRTASTGISRYVDGAMSYTSQDGYGTSMQMNVAGAIELDLGTRAIIGLKGGLETGTTGLSGGEFISSGEMRTSGANVGIYAARRLEGSAIIDGYIDAATLQHELSMADGGMSAQSNYGSNQVQSGVTLSGKYGAGAVSFSPSASLRHTSTHTDAAPITFTEADGSVTATEIEAIVEASTRFELTPRIDFNGSRKSLSSTSLLPKAICETMQDDQNCGFGFGVELQRSFEGGAGRFSAGAQAEQLGDRTSHGFRIGIDWAF